MPDESGELTTGDVSQYTGGRIPEDTVDAPAPESVRLLKSALAAARRYCGWRVTPPAVETITVDGPGRRLLSLPTLHVIELQSLTEDGVAVGLDTVSWSKVGLVRKKHGHCWSREYGSIDVAMNHGYDPDAAADWQSAVLELVDRMEAMAGKVVGNSGPMVERGVGHVTDRWALTISNPANQRLFSMLNHDLIDPYRLEFVG